MALPLPFNRTLRNMKRYQQILTVLVRHGFADVVHETRLDQLVEKGARLFTHRPEAEVAHMSRAERLRRAMEELGPTFIKLGQVLSTRRDLVPEEWAREFALLQDDCPQLPFDVIRERLEEEFPEKLDTIFKSIEPRALAAASMAQVHRGVLADGTHVAIKVLRPGIHDIIASDMEALRFIAGIVEDHFSNLGFSPTEVVNEFAKELKREVDLSNEGRSTDRLRGYFEHDEGVCFPKVYWEATTHNVLTLEEIHGVAMSRFEENGLNQDDRRKAVANGARAVFRQCLEIGFFHADPHPGNLFVQPGGRVCFIDCGMTGQIDPRTRHQIADMVQGVVAEDSGAVMRAAIELGDVDMDRIDERALRSDVHEIVGRFINIPLERLNVGELLDMFFQTLRKHPVRCPADLVLLIKAMTTIEAVAARVDPSFDAVTYARPYVEKLIRQRYSPANIAGRIKDTALAYTDLVEMLPGEIRDLLSRVRRSRLTINLEHKGLSRMTQATEHASRNIAYALIISALVVASSILVLAARDATTSWLATLGVAGFIVAGLFGMMLLISNYRLGKGP